jgi:serine/threonine-protein kinase
VGHAVPLHTGMEPFPGYHLRKPLGRGSFAEVWEAEAEDGQTVALKFLPCANGRATPEEIRSLQAVRQLSHPNLTRTFRVWCQVGYIVIAMELAEGSLADLLEVHEVQYGKPLSAEHVCYFLAQAADALDFLNTRQHHIDGRYVALQHCDIKPSNLLLFGDTIKLCDFGISTLMTSHTIDRRPSGTPDYSAPEIYRGRLSNRTDQYALAVSYCLLRGGRLPFNNTPRSFISTYVRPMPDLSMLPVKEQKIVLKALAPVPLDRWNSCGEFIDKLAQLII